MRLPGQTWLLLYNPPAVSPARLYYQSWIGGDCQVEVHDSISLLTFSRMSCHSSVYISSSYRFCLCTSFCKPSLAPTNSLWGCPGQWTYASHWDFCPLCLTPSRREKLSFLKAELKHWPHTALRQNPNHKQINRTSHLFTCLQWSIFLNASLDRSQKTAINLVETPEIFLLLRQIHHFYLAADTFSSAEKDAYQATYNRGSFLSISASMVLCLTIK